MSDTGNLMNLLSARRTLSLQGVAYLLRQQAIANGSDLEGWRLARRMRDAATDNQLSDVEQELGRYIQRNTSQTRDYSPALTRVA